MLEKSYLLGRANVIKILGLKISRKWNVHVRRE